MGVVYRATLDLVGGTCVRKFEVVRYVAGWNVGFAGPADPRSVTLRSSCTAVTVQRSPFFTQPPFVAMRRSFCLVTTRSPTPTVWPEVVSTPSLATSRASTRSDPDIATRCVVTV